MRGTVVFTAAILSSVVLLSSCSTGPTYTGSAPVTIGSSQDTTKTVEKTTEKVVTKTSTKTVEKTVTVAPEPEPAVEQATIDDGLVEVEYTVTGSDGMNLSITWDDENAMQQMEFSPALPFKKTLRMTPEVVKSAAMLHVRVLRSEVGDSVTCSMSLDGEVVTSITEDSTGGVMILFCQEGVFSDNGELSFSD